MTRNPAKTYTIRKNFMQGIQRYVMYPNRLNVTRVMGIKFFNFADIMPKKTRSRGFTSRKERKEKRERFTASQRTVFLK